MPPKGVSRKTKRSPSPPHANDVSPKKQPFIDHSHEPNGTTLHSTLELPQPVSIPNHAPMEAAATTLQQQRHNNNNNNNHVTESIAVRRSISHDPYAVAATTATAVVAPSLSLQNPGPYRSSGGSIGVGTGVHPQTPATTPQLSSSTTSSFHGDNFAPTTTVSRGASTKNNSNNYYEAHFDNESDPRYYAVQQHSNRHHVNDHTGAFGSYATAEERQWHYQQQQQQRDYEYTYSNHPHGGYPPPPPRSVRGQQMSAHYTGRDSEDLLPQQQQQQQGLYSNYDGFQYHSSSSYTTSNESLPRPYRSGSDHVEAVRGSVQQQHAPRTSGALDAAAADGHNDTDNPYGYAQSWAVAPRPVTPVPPSTMGDVQPRSGVHPRYSGSAYQHKDYDTSENTMMTNNSNGLGRPQQQYPYSSPSLPPPLRGHETYVPQNQTNPAIFRTTGGSQSSSLRHPESAGYHSTMLPIASPYGEIQKLREDLEVLRISYDELQRVYGKCYGEVIVLRRTVDRLSRALGGGGVDAQSSTSNPTAQAEADAATEKSRHATAVPTTSLRSADLTAEKRKRSRGARHRSSAEGNDVAMGTTDDADETASVFSDVGPSLHRPHVDNGSVVIPLPRSLPVIRGEPPYAKEGDDTAQAANNRSRQLHCAVCNIWVNSAQMMEAHEKGERHRKQATKLYRRAHATALEMGAKGTPEAEGGGGTHNNVAQAKNATSSPVLSPPEVGSAKTAEAERCELSPPTGAPTTTGSAVTSGQQQRLLEESVPGGAQNPFLRFLSQSKSQSKSQQQQQQEQGLAEEHEDGGLPVVRDDGQQQHTQHDVAGDDHEHATPPMNTSSSHHLRSNDRAHSSSSGKKSALVHSQGTNASSSNSCSKVSPDSKTSEELFAE